jgi:hypothetical protein
MTSGACAGPLRNEELLSVGRPISRMIGIIGRPPRCPLEDAHKPQHDDDDHDGDDETDDVPHSRSL